MIKSKNYSASSCGSRIVLASPECQKSSSVLENSNKDSYMLQSCSKSNFLIIELCDSIILERIEITNNESFSGNFNNVTIFASNKLLDHLNSNEWVFISKIRGNDSHDYHQSFSLTGNDVIPAFYKYIKLEFLDYHPTDHFYCTISSIKIFGIDIISDFFINPPLHLSSIESSSSSSDNTEYYTTTQNHIINLKSIFTSHSYLPSVRVKKSFKNFTPINPLKSLHHRLNSLEYLLTKRDDWFSSLAPDLFHPSCSKHAPSPSPPLTHTNFPSNTATTTLSSSVSSIEEEILKRLKILEEGRQTPLTIIQNFFLIQILILFLVLIFFFIRKKTSSKIFIKSKKQDDFQFSKSPTLLLDESRADIMTPYASLNDVIFSSTENIVDLPCDDHKPLSNSSFAPPLFRRRSLEFFKGKKSRKRKGRNKREKN